jgi:SAM-dependent methyltransferase
MKEDNKIEDYATYISRMNKSMLDKAFFLDKIESSAIVDYGCGNGDLLNFIIPYVDKDVHLYGYDNDRTMIQEAQAKTSRITFASDLTEIMELVDKLNIRPTLVLSSVIHEVYSYFTPPQIDEFWKTVFSGKFDYIVIRDMIPSRTMARPSDINDVAKVYKRFLNEQALTDFESIWGSVEDNKNLVHFLLKYRYLKPNWAREVKENYMPLYREDLLALLDTCHYEIVYHEHYVLPYIKDVVRKDFSIELKDNTHLKLILRKK